MARSVASYLTCFDRPPPPVVDPAPPEAPFVPAPPAESGLCDAERAQIRAEAQAEAAARYDDALAMARLDFERQQDEERARWANDEGARLGASVEQALHAGFDALRADLERILQPFVSRKILEHILADFVETLNAAIADKKEPAIRLSGPQDLLDIIGARLAQAQIATQIVPDDAIEVTARIGSTTVETRMTDWLKQLRNAGEAP